MRVRVFSAAEHTPAVIAVFENEPLVTAMVVMKDACRRPTGDLIEADVPREVTTALVAALHATGVSHRGTIHVHSVESWISRRGAQAEQLAPGSEADSVVWNMAIQQAYNKSELDGTYLGLITLATLLGGIAIVLDSQILTIGAMVLGPDFGPIVALGIGLVTHRQRLLRRAARTLTLGFVFAITVATILAIIAAQAGWFTEADLHGEATAFIYSPNRWSFVIALIAAMAGVLSITSAQTAGISGVFISVTTIPAASNIAVATAVGDWDQVGGSALQLLINIVTMIVAGWLTLSIQRRGVQFINAKTSKEEQNS